MTPAPILNFDPHAPQKLIDLYRKLGTLRAVEKARKVNKKFIYNLLVYGIEPTNRANRKALFLRITPPRPRAKRQPVPPHKEWWWKLPSDFKNEVVKDLYLKELEKNFHA